MTATNMLRLDGLSRRFGGVTALHDISLDVPAGARRAVIGPNGAGKTTLLNLIAGTVLPSSGTITVNGRDVTRLAVRSRARYGVGRTFQHPAVFRRLTVAQNLELATARPDAGEHRRLAADRVAELNQEYDLAQHLRVPAGQLAYGLQRRLELAMALAGRPRLLLLDEPSAGLDLDEIGRLTATLTNLTADTTLLLVDHHLDLVWAVAQTVTVLHHGHHLATGTPDQVRADPSVRDAYLAPPSSAGITHRPTARPDRGRVVLQVRQLRAGYRGAPVLDGVDFDVHAGEAVAILGRNGAGKTTLINALAGALPVRTPTRIDWDGTALPVDRLHNPARAGIALVPQGRRIFAGLTVHEHFVCARAAHRRSSGRPADQEWTVDRVLQLFPAIAARLHLPAQRLSGGEQQMLAVARALLTQPRLLILDEPSEGLAPGVIALLTHALQQLVTDGLAVLVAEQNLPMAAALTDRLLVLDRGHLAVSMPTAELDLPGRRTQLAGLLGLHQEPA